MADGNTEQPMQLIKAYPNPFNDNINVMMNYKQNGFIRLEAYNALGALAYSSTMYAVNAGVCNIAYDIKNLTEGLYLFKVMNYDNEQSLINLYSFKSIKINWKI